MRSSWRAPILALLVLLGACHPSGTGRPFEVRSIASTTSTTAAPPTTTSTSEAPRPVVRASRSLVRPRPYVAVDDAFWRRVANCESPSNARSRNGLYGGYFQMTQSSWHGGGGEGVPETHTYDEQLVVAKTWAAMTNPWKQWPVCWPRAARG